VKETFGLRQNTRRRDATSKMQRPFPCSNPCARLNGHRSATYQALQKRQWETGFAITSGVARQSCWGSNLTTLGEQQYLL